MTNTIKTNIKFYMPLVTLLCSFTYILNYCSKIYSCAIAFTLLALTVNVITNFFGREKALKTVTLAVIVSLLLSWNLVYFIHGQAISGMVAMSLVSVLLGSVTSTHIIKTLSLRTSFNKSNFFALFGFAVVDASLMAMFFMSKLPAERVITIFAKEIGFKLVYAAIIFAVIAAAKIIITKSKEKVLV